MLERLFTPNSHRESVSDSGIDDVIHTLQKKNKKNIYHKIQQEEFMHVSFVVIKLHYIPVICQLFATQLSRYISRHIILSLLWILVP